jgi:hypothetical protein
MDGIRCNECNGEGYVSDFAGPTYYNSIGAACPTEYELECSECDGTGVRICTFCRKRVAERAWDDGAVCSECLEEDRKGLL